MRVAVYGLWHLGCVTAACLAEARHRVVGLDLDEATVAALQQGRAPLHEPGLDELLRAGLAQGGLSFSTDPVRALANADVLWVAFDTPVDDRDRADVQAVRSKLEAIREAVPRGTLVLISSQVPVGFTRGLEQDWAGQELRFAYSPENLRLGKALESFRKPDRVVLGCRPEDKPRLLELFRPFTSCIEWMSIESAEMTKHALNAFLAASVTFINEVARLCEEVGADAKEVERGLKSEPRIGPRAYLSPGAAFAGGTLARDVQFLRELGSRFGQSTPLLQGVMASNQDQKSWVIRHVRELVREATEPVVAVLGLTYKPGTNTLRRSSSLELCRELVEAGIILRAHDPLVTALPQAVADSVVLCPSVTEVLDGADVAVVATEHPDYRQVCPGLFIEMMRRPQIIDQNHFLASGLRHHPGIVYVASGLPRRTQAACA